MDNTKQVETVKKALDLEIVISNTQNSLVLLSLEKFRAVPTPPKCEVIQRTYPEIIPQTKVNWVLAIVPALVFWPWVFIYYFAIYKKEKEADIERIRNSDEYKAQCSELDKGFDQQQEAANQRYAAAKHVYDTETLPGYQKELDAWTTQHNEKVKKLESKLRSAQDELKQLYEATKIVPLQYRSIPALQYIYNIISTSDYDVKQAIDLYDRNEQRKLDEARLREQELANDLAYEQNALLNEQNVIAAKARRDANIAAAVGAVQRHNTNKALKNLTKK